MSKYKEIWSDCIGIVTDDDLYASEHNRDSPQYPFIKMIEIQAVIDLEAKLEKAKKACFSLEQTLNWVYDGIQHFNKEEDLKQAEHLSNKIIKDLKSFQQTLKELER